MKRGILLIVSLAVLLVSACQRGKTVDATALSRVQTVGIVSVTGESEQFSDPALLQPILGDFLRALENRLASSRLLRPVPSDDLVNAVPDLAREAPVRGSHATARDNMPDMQHVPTARLVELARKAQIDGLLAISTRYDIQRSSPSGWQMNVWSTAYLHAADGTRIWEYNTGSTKAGEMVIIKVPISLDLKLGAKWILMAKTSPEDYRQLVKLATEAHAERAGNLGDKLIALIENDVEAARRTTSR